MGDTKQKKPGPKRLEDYEPGATRDKVMAALVKAAKPIKKPEK